MTADSMLPDNDPIAAALASLTDFRDANGAPIAAAALAASAPRARLISTLSRPLPVTLLASIVALFMLITVASLALPSLGKARASARPPASVASEVAYGYAPELDLQAVTEATGRIAPGASLSPFQPAADAPARAVIRKCTLDLKVADLRATFARVALLPSQAQGEYLESADLTGSPEPTGASIVLRVRADRLSSVLNDLRALGEVTLESTRGEDVTDQVIDLDARLRNESRVETELLDLLSSRKDSPLKEVLDLRQAISDCRERIERMTAQRDRLSRLVSLATVLVNLRPAVAPEPRADGLWARFLDDLDSAWRSGLDTLAATVAAIVRIALAGLIWWLLLAFAITAAVRLRRNARRRAAAEPAPAL